MPTYCIDFFETEPSRKIKSYDTGLTTGNSLRTRAIDPLPSLLSTDKRLGLTSVNSKHILLSSVDSLLT